MNKRRRRVLAVMSVMVLGAAAVLVTLELSSQAPAPRAPVRAAITPAMKRAIARAARKAAFRAQIAAVQRLARYGLPLFCGAPRKRLVALTFDDGPGVYSHFAIKKLRAYHARATFFLVGKEIPVWPGIAQRERPLAAFGDHTMTHPFLPGLSQAAMTAEIADAQALIARTTREPVVLFRPPYEARTSAVDAEAQRLGMLEVLWNVDSADSLGANYAGIARNVIAGLAPGSIILMHENRGQTIRALSPILRAVRRKHLRAVTVPELVAQDPPTLHQLQAGSRGCSLSLSHGNGA
jgi:peptidoglycan-N-acetylglucosamine deacetylase